jgi:hypothetical protein
MWIAECMWKFKSLFGQLIVVFFVVVVPVAIVVVCHKFKCKVVLVVLIVGVIVDNIISDCALLTLVVNFNLFYATSLMIGKVSHMINLKFLQSNNIPYFYE